MLGNLQLGTMIGYYQTTAPIYDDAFARITSRGNEGEPEDSTGRSYVLLTDAAPGTSAVSDESLP